MCVPRVGTKKGMWPGVFLEAGSAAYPRARTGVQLRAWAGVWILIVPGMGMAWFPRF